jgi:LuxR family transcriptional regulator, maltose regulon positive regulatory protein
MKSRFLETKFHIPIWRTGGVTRPRLLESLQTGLVENRKLTVFSAPAGYGKTTLVSEWIQSLDRDMRVAWLSLDKDDNDPARFLGYCAAAFHRVDDSIGQDAQRIVDMPQLPPLQILLDELINELAMLDDQVVMVLDDYHVITDPKLHEALDYFIEHQPPQLHLAITTREDPPLSLAHIRARGQLTEIRAQDLRFTLAEARQFFKQSMKLDLTEETICALDTRTEGWAAGLQLAALALQGRSETAEFAQQFSGTHRYIIDYLVEQVLQRQSAETRDFLICTSILDRLSAPLCDALLAGKNSTPSSVQLEYLERANLFLIPLDDEREWYRYHHLFSELLQHTLSKTPNIQTAELHRRASVWYEAHGFLQDAFNHVFKAEDWDYAAQLVGRHAMEIFRQSRVAALQDWLGRFPENVIQSRPALRIFHAWILMMTYRADYRPMINEKIRQVEQALAAGDHPQLAPLGPGGALIPLREWAIGQVCALRGQLLLAAFNEPIDPQELIALSARSLELLPETDKTVRSMSIITIAHAHLMLGNLAEAEKTLAETLKMTLDAGNYFTAVTAIFYQARIAYQQGYLKRALDICVDGLAQITPKFKNPDQDFPAIRSLYVMQGVVLLEWGQLEEARRLLELATNLVGWALWVEVIAYTALARLWETLGDFEKVLGVIRRMEKMGPQIAYSAEALRIKHLVTHPAGNADAKEAAIQFVETYRSNLESSHALEGIGPFQVDVEYIALYNWLQVQVAIGRSKETLAFLPKVLTPARKNGLRHRLIELSIIQAMALSEIGETRRAHEVLLEALSLAEPEGYLNILNQGTLINRLLIELSGKNNAREYIQRLSTAFQPAKENSSSANQSGLIDPLSEREIEVLRLLVTGATLQKIAKQLFLSPNTLKAHTQNIYIKLDVHSRVEAANKARELGLI